MTLPVNRFTYNQGRTGHTAPKGASCYRVDAGLHESRQLCIGRHEGTRIVSESAPQDYVGDPPAHNNLHQDQLVRIEPTDCYVQLTLEDESCDTEVAAENPPHQGRHAPKWLVYPHALLNQRH